MGKRAQIPTERIIEEIKAGRDADANYKRLFDHYSQQIYIFYVKKGLSAEDSRDLTQEVFISAFKNIGELQEPKKFQHWLFKIARNVYLNARGQKKAKKRNGIEVPIGSVSEALLTETADELTAADADPLNTILEEEKRGGLRDAVDALPAQMRRCVYLRIVKGMSNTEIAETMGISVNTVKAHLQQAKRILKEKLLRHLLVII